MCLRNIKTKKSKRKFAYKVLKRQGVSLLKTPYAGQFIDPDKWNKAKFTKKNASLLVGANKVSFATEHLGKFSVCLSKPVKDYIHHGEKVFKVEIKYKELLVGNNFLYLSYPNSLCALVDEIKIVKQIN